VNTFSMALSVVLVNPSNLRKSLAPGDQRNRSVDVRVIPLHDLDQAPVLVVVAEFDRPVANGKAE